jgi:hypothetical protein
MENNTQEVFFPIFVFVGVFLGSSAAYMTFKMYSVFNLLIYMLAPAISMSCFGLALLLTFLANDPYKNSRIFKLHWNQLRVSKIHRKMLYACKPVGFKIGAYGMATSKLGLLICDDIIQNTVALLVLS